MVLFDSMKRRLGGIINWFWQLSLFKKLVVIILVVLVGWFGIPKIIGQKNNQPAYQTATVERGTFIQSVSASGNITSGGNVTITTAATGIVKNLFVKTGDNITQGQNIAQLSLDQSSQQKQAAAYASYLSAQNSLNTAKSNMNSLQAALFTANQTFVKGAGIQNPITDDPTYIIQRANWLQAEANYTNQQNIINQAQAGLTSSWLSYQQSSSIITAPSSGKISNLIISPGYQIVDTSSSNSNSTSTTTTLGTISLTGGQLQATVNLSEVDVTSVKVGHRATLTLDAFSEKTFTGKVTAIDTTGAISSGVTTYPGTITFDATNTSIYPNMGVSAKIITTIKDDVVLVPTGAVQTANGASTVQIMKNNQVTSVPVELGVSNDTQTEIVSGINEGDTVVTGQTSTTSTGSTGTTTSPFGNTRGGIGGAGGFSGGSVIRSTGR